MMFGFRPALRLVTQQGSAPRVPWWTDQPDQSLMMNMAQVALQQHAAELQRAAASTIYCAQGPAVVVKRAGNPCG
jgi:hypothetical protein